VKLTVVSPDEMQVSPDARAFAGKTRMDRVLCGTGVSAGRVPRMIQKRTDSFNHLNPLGRVMA
jgi:hypothetical protein